MRFETKKTHNNSTYQDLLLYEPPRLCFQNLMYPSWILDFSCSIFKNQGTTWVWRWFKLGNDPNRNLVPCLYRKVLEFFACWIEPGPQWRLIELNNLVIFIWRSAVEYMISFILRSWWYSSPWILHVYFFFFGRLTLVADREKFLWYFNNWTPTKVQ